VDSRKAEVVFPAPPFGETKAIVGMGDLGRIAEGKLNSIRKLSDSKRLSVGYWKAIVISIK
jgi:hypothetical protein